SMDIMAMMSSPLCRGLFRRAILESGAPPRTLARPLGEAEKAGLAVAAKLGAPPDRALAFLRSVAPAGLLKAGPDINSFSVDGWVFPSPPFDVWHERGEYPVPI